MTDASAIPRLYDDLASWWPLLSAPEDYAEEAAFYQRLLLEGCPRERPTLLELGSGGGNNASHLKARFDMLLTDSAPGMVEVGRALNPECEHLVADMRTLRLDRRFDAVLAHDAISYMTTEADLRAAMETAFVHCEPGGVTLFVPDHLRETFAPSTDHGGHDGDGRALRYLEWIHDPDPDDTTYLVDYAYLLRDENGTTRVEQDRHEVGAFPRATWMELLADVGFEARVLPLEHSELESGRHLLFACRRPA